MGFDLAHTISSISKLVLRAMRVSNKNELSPMKAVMMVCVHSKDAEILKGKLLPTIKHWTSCMWLNKLIISFWRGIGTIL